MAEPYVGQVVAVGFNFAPVGWQLCDGSLLSIAEYQALYTLIGTIYGGDGTNTFAVPDLRGRGVNSQGQAPRLQNYNIGQMAGFETVTLTTPNMPAHSHFPQAQPSAASGTAAAPSNTTVFGGPIDTTIHLYGPVPATPVALNNAVVTPSIGGSQPHENMQPYQVVNYIIALLGIYPSQS